VIAAENCDEGDGGGSADEEIRDHVGELEGGVESVGVGVSSEEIGDVFDPYQPHDAREHGRGYQEERGCKGSVAVRGAEE
jgi:hypothetical protein